jgi:hypothetical protein
MYILLSGEMQEKMMTPDLEMLLGGKIVVKGMLVRAWASRSSTSRRSRRPDRSDPDL